MLPQIVINEASEPSLLAEFAPYLSIVVALIALLGVAANARWMRKGTEAGWRRDRRLEVYTRLSAALVETSERLALLGVLETAAQRNSLNQETVQAKKAINIAVQEIRILGPQHVAHEADMARIQFGSTIKATLARCIAAESDDSPLGYIDQKEFLVAIDRFAAAASKALG